MAKIKVNGFGEIETAMKRLTDREMIRQTVEAGADVVVREMRERIQSAGHVRTRAMLNAVGKTEYRERLNGGTISVYPQGLDSRGYAYAMKMFVINYGPNKKKKTRGKKSGKSRMGDKFITNYFDRIEAAALAAMEAEADRLIDSIIK